MKLKEMVEILQHTHPEASMSYIITNLNRAIDDFSRQTEIIESDFRLANVDESGTVTSYGTVSGQRYYGLVDNIIKIRSVDIHNGTDLEEAPMLVGRPKKRDLT